MNIGSTLTEAQREFRRRVMQEWLPAFCDDAKRRYDAGAFDPEAKVITDEDARDFMKAVDNGVAHFDARQRMGMSRGYFCDPLFTEGEKRHILVRSIFGWRLF